MYLSGRIEIDPSQMTIIKRAKPTKIFGKLLDALTLGQSSEKLEQETFTALSILQQLSMSLRRLNINNVIRLAVDDYDFYLDESGTGDDLNQAMFELKAKIDPLESEIFKTIYLVLEHLENSINYLIEISVMWKHKVGEYPINITINGVFEEFKLRGDETRDQLEERMNNVFKSQTSYDRFIDEKKGHFDDFLESLELEIRKVVKIDDVRRRSDVKILRPERRINSTDDIKVYRQLHSKTGKMKHADPIFYGYFGFDDFLFYTWLWGSGCFANNLYCHDFSLVNETGNSMMNVGENGIYAGANDAMNDYVAIDSQDMNAMGNEPNLSDDDYGFNEFAVDGPDSDDSFDDDFGSDGYDSGDSDTDY